MIAKNVGIRRARGRFVLATNIDILFNDELMRFLKSGGLRPGKMYRIDRTDVDSEVPVDAPVEQQLAYCHAHQIRLACRYGYYLLDPTGCIAPEADDVTTGDCVALKMGFYPVAHDFTGRTYRWCGDEAVVVVRPSAPGGRLFVELEPGPCLNRVPFPLRVEDERGALVGEGLVGSHGIVSVALPRGAGAASTYRFRPLAERRRLPDDYRALDLRVYRVGLAPEQGGPPFRFDALGRGGAVWRNAVRAVGRAVGRLWHRPFIPNGIHIGACGDFTLMAREHWLDLRGYAEFPAYSLNIDTLLCWAAVYAGIEEVVLDPPLATYHIDHSLGSGATPEGEKLLLERLSRAGVPVVTAADVYEHVRRIAPDPTARPFNAEDWGMRDEALPETHPGGRAGGLVA
jgi:hypothetical protein